jgi:hypothetical protein
MEAQRTLNSKNNLEQEQLEASQYLISKNITKLL